MPAGTSSGRSTVASSGNCSLRCWQYHARASFRAHLAWPRPFKQAGCVAQLDLHSSGSCAGRWKPYAWRRWSSVMPLELLMVMAQPQSPRMAAGTAAGGVVGSAPAATTECAFFSNARCRCDGGRAAKDRSKVWETAVANLAQASPGRGPSTIRHVRASSASATRRSRRRPGSGVAAALASPPTSTWATEPSSPPCLSFWSAEAPFKASTSA